jgi:Uncharacterized protein conserved in bacteria
MKKAIFCSVFILLSFAMNAQVEKMLGKWNTIDDRTGGPKAIVNIQKSSDGYYYGSIEGLYEKNDRNEFRLSKTIPKEYQKIIGMQVLKKLELKGNDLKGIAYDPETDETYHGKITYDASRDVIILRGSIDRWGVIGRSQTWVRCKN